MSYLVGGPHFFALSRVRTGTIILDMFKPINFPMQLFIRGSSEFVLNLITYTVPTILVGIVLIKMKMVFSIHNFMLFGLAFIISYLLLFEFQLILAFISIKTLELNGIIHFFHAMVMLFSCQVIPMDMYPKFMQVIINLLPFKYIFYFPLSIIITMVPFNVDVFKNTIIIEIVWLVILAIICLRLWKWSKGEVCVQGG